MRHSFQNNIKQLSVGALFALTTSITLSASASASGYPVSQLSLAQINLSKLCAPHKRGLRNVSLPSRRSPEFVAGMHRIVLREAGAGFKKRHDAITKTVVLLNSKASQVVKSKNESTKNKSAKNDPTKNDPTRRALCTEYRKASMRLHHATQREMEKNSVFFEAVARYQTNYCRAAIERRIAMKHDVVFNQLIGHISDERLAQQIIRERQQIPRLIKMAQNAPNKQEMRLAVLKLHHHQKQLRKLLHSAYTTYPDLQATLSTIVHQNRGHISPVERQHISAGSYKVDYARSGRQLRLSC